MLPIEWRAVGFMSLGIALIAVPVANCWLVRRRRLLVKVIVATVATPAAVLGIACTAFFSFICWIDRANHSALQFSPNRELAARVENSGGFGTEDVTSVVIYFDHGLRSNVVFTAEWDEIRPSNIRWTDDRDLVISYSRGDVDFQCQDSATVRVQCIQE
jgi:hypothetical protein